MKAKVMFICKANSFRLQTFVTLTTFENVRFKANLFWVSKFVRLLSSEVCIFVRLVAFHCIPTSVMLTYFGDPQFKATGFLIHTFIIFVFIYL